MFLITKVLYNWWEITLAPLHTQRENFSKHFDLSSFRLSAVHILISTSSVLSPPLYLDTIRRNCEMWDLATSPRASEAKSCKSRVKFYLCLKIWYFVHYGFLHYFWLLRNSAEILYILITEFFSTLSFAPEVKAFLASLWSWPGNTLAQRWALDSDVVLNPSLSMNTYSKYYLS